MVKPSATLPNLTGTVVDDGCLELVKILGAGAFGKLYKARVTASPSSSPTLFAVKCLREPTTPHEAHLQAKEYALHHRVSRHPNVVTLRRRFVDSEYLFIVMDLCVGGDMHGAITKGVYCGETALIKRTFIGLIDGVRFCHSRSVFHRDLKPANVLVDADGGRPRIADFGLSTASNLSLVPCGSPGYMCPESFGPISTPYSPALSDTWALAVVLVNLVVAQNPWMAAVERDVRWNSFMADQDFLREIFPLSRPLNALLQRCFSTNTALRPTLCEMRAEVLAIPDFFMS
ncbi:kinase-like domain-containing protein, partial [Mycena polygramma]